MCFDSRLSLSLSCQASLHRQRHPQEDDPLSRRPLLQDPEDPDPAHGGAGPRVPAQRDDQGGVGSSVNTPSCTLATPGASRKPVLNGMEIGTRKKPIFIINCYINVGLLLSKENIAVISFFK